MTDEKKEQIRDKAMRIYWLMVVAAIFFALGVLYGTSTNDDEILPLTTPDEAEAAQRQPIHITIVHDCPPVESPPSASQGV